MCTGVNLVSGGEGVRLLCARWAMSSVNLSLFSRLTFVDGCLLESSGVQDDFKKLLFSEFGEREVNGGCGFSSLCTGEMDVALWTGEMVGLLFLETRTLGE